MRLIYLSPVPWNSFTQRPHEFVSYFHKTSGGNVLWIDPYPTRMPTSADFKRSRVNRGQESRQIPDWLRVYHPRCLPIEPIPGVAALNNIAWRSIVKQTCEFAKKGQTILAIGKPSLLALRLLDVVENAYSIYDAMDDFPEFYSGISRRSMARHEKAIAERVTQLLVSSSNLALKFSAYKHGVLILNACRCDLPAPKSIKRHSKRPLVGYVGTLGGWFNWSLLIHLAAILPDYDFRLIGPLFSAVPQKLPINIDIRPPLEHAAVLAAMRDFDIGIIPFKRNKLTDSVDPIKYYEYRAMGLPVVSSSFGEMALRNTEDGVFILDDMNNVRDTFRKATEYQSDIQSTMFFRQENSWDHKFAQAKLFVDNPPGK